MFQLIHTGPHIPKLACLLPPIETLFPIQNVSHFQGTISSSCCFQYLGSNSACSHIIIQNPIRQCDQFGPSFLIVIIKKLHQRPFAAIYLVGNLHIVIYIHHLKVPEGYCLSRGKHNHELPSGGLEIEEGAILGRHVVSLSLVLHTPAMLLLLRLGLNHLKSQPLCSVNTLCWLGREVPLQSQLCLTRLSATWVSQSDHIFNRFIIVFQLWVKDSTVYYLFEIL